MAAIQQYEDDEVEREPALTAVELSLRSMSEQLYALYREDREDRGALFTATLFYYYRLGTRLLAAAALGREEYEAFVAAVDVTSADRSISRRLAEQYDEASLQSWLDAATAVGFTLTWSHLRAIIGCDPDDRARWMQRTLDERLSVHALFAAIKDENEPTPAGSPSSGRVVSTEDIPTFVSRWRRSIQLVVGHTRAALDESTQFRSRLASLGADDAFTPEVLESLRRLHTEMLELETIAAMSRGAIADVCGFDVATEA